MRTACLAAALAALCAASAFAQRPSDPNRALVLDVKGEVTAKAPGGAPAPVTKGAELAKGQELATGVDSEVKLAFADGTVMVVNEMTQILLAELLTKGSRQAVNVALKLGEVSAQVNPKKDFQTDFKLTTPSGTASVRGTKIESLSYHPVRGMECNLANGSLLFESNTGTHTNMSGGDHSAVATDGHLSTPEQFTAETSRLHTEPPVTQAEAQTIAVTNQPQGSTPSAANQSVTSAGGSTFVFRFQRQ